MAILESFLNTLADLANKSGFAGFLADGGWKNVIMILISFVFMYLAIAKGFEPLRLLPISFGMLLTNLPGAGMYHSEFWQYMEKNEVDPTGATVLNDHYLDYGYILRHGGLLDILYLGVKLQLYPPLIFLGIGAMTDFGPLIANPKSFLLGAAAQGGIFFTFIGAALLGMTAAECASIAIIGGADGPTAIFVSAKLLSNSDSIGVGTIALAAYTYMALVPIIQPPIMKALTTKKERSVVMGQLRTVSKTEKILFPIVITIVVCLILPTTAPLVGMLMLGNLFRESGVVKQLSETASNALMYIVVILLGTSVGASTSAEAFLNVDTLKIVVLGLVAFACGTFGGVMLGKLLCKVTHGKINPLIGSAGVSAVPMAARVSQKVGAEADPTNFLLMHAMGPNVAGVIGTAVAAGTFMAIFGV